MAARSIVVLDTIQEVRDLPHSLRAKLSIYVPQAHKLYTYVGSSTEEDDGSTWLRPTTDDCTCCQGRGRWYGTAMGGSGGGGEAIGLPINESDVTGLVSDLNDLAAADSAEATARAAADSAEAAARAAADALLTPKSRVLTGTAPIRIDGGASADLSADRTLSVNDADATNKGVVKLANDLGGTAASPKVVAITETSGPTQLVVGAIATGKLLKRSSGTLIGHTIGDMAGQEATSGVPATAPDSLPTLGQVQDLIDGITGATPITLQYRRGLRKSDFLVDTLDAQDFGGTGVSVTITIDEAQDVTINFGGSIFRDSGAAIWKGKMGIRITSSDPVTDETYVMPKENWHSGAGDDTINAVGMAGHFTRQGLDPGTYTIELYWGRTDSDDHEFTLLGESDGYEAGLTVEYTNLETAIGYTSNRSARLYNHERLF